VNLIELVPRWIDYLKKMRVRVGTKDVMLLGLGARMASMNNGAMRMLMAEGLAYESKDGKPAAWLPTRERVEEEAKRPLTDEEWEEFRERLYAAIAMMFDEGMLG